MIEILSIDLSNYCSKQCYFCYNHSTLAGNTLWNPSEVIDFAVDCVKHGVKAISLGGGEPFEYEGVFDVIDGLFPLCYLSVTSNGLPLENVEIWKKLVSHKPDKIHITIHHPDDAQEVERVELLVKRIDSIGIKPGVNLLVSADRLNESSVVFQRFCQVLSNEQIILVPQRLSNTPSPKQLSVVARGMPFQSPSCLLGCNRPTNFCSVSWDKKVNACSFARGKYPLKTLDYHGLMEALELAEWQCRI